jgi:hypothetical protein
MGGLFGIAKRGLGLLGRKENQEQQKLQVYNLPLKLQVQNLKLKKQKNHLWQEWNTPLMLKTKKEN